MTAWTIFQQGNEEGLFILVVCVLFVLQEHSRTIFWQLWNSHQQDILNCSHVWVVELHNSVIIVYWMTGFLWLFTVIGFLFWFLFYMYICLHVFGFITSIPHSEAEQYHAVLRNNIVQHTANKWCWVTEKVGWWFV